jgi:uncharacterized protein
MAKPVSGTCNLDCRYCYYKGKPAELYPATARPRMSDDVLAAFTRQYLAANPTRCEFGWQGGEPLLAGREFFARAVGYQKEFGRAGQHVANGLQTNGSLLDDAWCEWLAANKFVVGISIDGPAEIHDVYRRDKAGGPTFERAWAGLELLKKHGVAFNVLATITSASAPRAAEVYRFLADRGVQHLQFIPVFERLPGTDEPAEFSCSGEALGRAMIAIFREWMAGDISRVWVRFINDAFEASRGSDECICVHCKRCAEGYVLEWNGDLYICDHFVEERWRLGNLMETPLGELIARPQVAEFAALKTDLPADCRACEFLKVCWGGCPKHHLPVGREARRVNHFCAGYRMFFTEVRSEINRLAREEARERSLARQASALPPSRQAPIPPAPSGAVRGKPGRNDRCPCGSGLKFKRCCGRG